MPGPGLEGAIEIEPGARMPLIPRHVFKAFGEVRFARMCSSISVWCQRRARMRGATKTTRMHPTASYYLGDGSDARIRGRESRRALSGDAAHRHPAPDEQSLRPAVRDGVTARREWVHRTRIPSSRVHFPRRAASSRSGTERSWRPARQPRCGSALGLRCDRGSNAMGHVVSETVNSGGLLSQPSVDGQHRDSVDGGPDEERHLLRFRVIRRKVLAATQPFFRRLGRRPLRCEAAR